MVSSSIKQLKIEDSEQITHFLEKCYKIMNYKKGTSSFDYNCSKNSVEQLINSGLGFFNGYYEDNTLLGIFAYTLVPSIMNSNFVQAEELAWHAEPSLNYIKRGKIMLKLLDSFENDLKRHRQIDAIHIIFSNKNLIRFLKKRGYDEIQYHCIKEFN